MTLHKTGFCTALPDIGMIFGISRGKMKKNEKKSPTPKLMLLSGHVEIVYNLNHLILFCLLKNKHHN